MADALKAPFPWFGGKSRAADLIWAALGDVDSYVEPFFGSGAVLLGRPSWHRVRVETVNDKDAYLANFWRAVSMDPDAVAAAADWPVSEADLTARHLWLLEQGPALTERLQCDPLHYDARVAGWWVWGTCASIGQYCYRDGPWATDGHRFIRGPKSSGITRTIPAVGNLGRGIHATCKGDRSRFIVELMRVLEGRLRDVRVCCGDWERVVSDGVWRGSNTGTIGGILFDPPYLEGRDSKCGLYSVGTGSVARDVETWCRENGHRKELRIVLCGYAGNYDLPGWRVVPWKAGGGYGSQGEDNQAKANSAREMLWLSPACLGEPEQLGLFG